MFSPSPRFENAIGSAAACVAVDGRVLPHLDGRDAQRPVGRATSAEQESVARELRADVGLVQKRHAAVSVKRGGRRIRTEMRRE